MNKNITIVTGLWDLGRGSIDTWSKRDFEVYKKHFFELLQVDVNMVLWIPKELEDDVLKIRDNQNTKIYIKEVNEFKTWFPFFDKVQKIRTDERWYNSVGWLSGSPQSLLEYYNPIMMSKMFMLHDTMIMNPLNSEYFYWIDGGITSTVSTSLLRDDKVLENLENYSSSIEKFIHITYPYVYNDEIHGFERKKMAEYCGVDFVNYVSRGGFFGGHKDILSQINQHYYNILEKTLNEGFMGADECLFTILTHRYPNLIERFIIEENGLIYPFFENLKKYKNSTSLNIRKVGLYVITFNSPSQFETLIESMIRYDHTFIDKPKKYLLDNSTDLSTTPKYIELCEQYGFEHIKKNNLGICGGRQFIAEHFESTGLDYYFFFEDDMFFYPKEGSVCRNGFNRYFDDFYKRILEIIKKEDFDFLKLNYSEFYGDNGTQWAWYNVPQHVRDEYWPNNNKLPQMGFDPNAPKTNFKRILSNEGIPYTDGEIYYCNWPQIVSKTGNKKMFIDVKWKSPYEQTWMSHIYQETKKGNIKPGLILGTPTEHNRFDFYPKEERREN